MDLMDIFVNLKIADKTFPESHRQRGLESFT